MSNSHKSVISFPTPPQDPQQGKRPDEAANYLAYLLELADRLFHGSRTREREDESAA